MKKTNICLNIMNILEIIFIGILPITLFDFLHLYSLYMLILRMIFYFAGILNIIWGSVNIKKKNVIIGILYIIIGIISSILILINHTSLQDEFSENLISILNYSILFIVGLLSFINIILNRKIENDKKHKIAISMFIIVIIINIIIILFITIIHLNNINNFKKTLENVQNDSNIETYILNSYNGECIFIDTNGNEITRKKYNIVYSFDKYKINGKFVYLAKAKTVEGKIILINTVGEEIYQFNTGIPIEYETFELNNGNDEKYILDKTSLLLDFIYYIREKKQYKFETMSLDEMFETDIGLNYNTLDEYEETNKSFEDNPNYTYMYFKNSKIMNNVLQVVIKEEIEDDNKLIENYEEYCKYSVNIEKMKEFYKFKKEYYLIDFMANTKIKLECNNLIYESIYLESGKENNRIILCQNGYIPFYDKFENGYFNKLGEKKRINSSYLLYDVNDKNMIVIEKSTGKTLILSNETSQIERKFDETLIEFNGFYLLYLDGEYKLLDNNFNIIDVGYELKFIGEHYLCLNDANYNSALYYYNDNGIQKIYLNLNRFNFMKSNDLMILSSNIYSNIGIANPNLEFEYSNLDGATEIID